MSKATPVEAVDPSKKTSEIKGPVGDEMTIQMTQMEAKCYWNDAAFDSGEQVSANGKCYECSFGYWIEVTN